MHPVLFRIPGVDWPLHTYGVLIVTGFLLAMFVAHREAKRQGRYADETLDFAFWALLGGMIGARVVFIIVNWREYFIDHFWESVGPIPASPVVMVVGALLAVAGLFLGAGDKKMPGRVLIGVGVVLIGVGKFVVSGEIPAFNVPAIFVIWKGGLVFYGSALGGFLAFLWYTNRHGIHGVDKLFLADLLVVGVPLAHVFGRLGCVSAGCCWGDAAAHLDAAGHVIQTFPIGISFPNEALAYSSLISSVDAETATWMREHHSTLPLIPTQLMESFGEGCVFLILLVVRSRKWFHGQVLLTYGILYPILRTIMEMMRGDTERGYVIPGVLSTSQFISLFVAAASLIAIFVMRRRGLASIAAPSTPN